MSSRMKAEEIAVGHWPEILSDAGIDEKYLSKKHGPCPACGGTDRFRFDDKNGHGTFFCSHCGAGNGFKLLNLVFGWDFKEAAEKIRNYFGDRPIEVVKKVEYRKAKTEEEELAKTKAYLIRTWRQAKPVTPGDPVWRYLTITRKLPLKFVTRDIRYHPGLRYVDEDGKYLGTFPVMLALVRGPDGKAKGLHRTYLTPKGEKAPVPDPKKLMKSCGIQGGAIRLVKPGKKLGVAEGIETAYAVMAMYKLPCWATVSSTILKGFVPPEGVEEIVIFSDNDLPDETGRKAGQEDSAFLRDRMKTVEKKVQLVMPLQPGTDFDDVFQQKQKQALAKKAGKRPAQAKAA